MVQTCSKCSRVNPADASYCYFDGNLLRGDPVNEVPIGAVKQSFPHPFVFPSGKICGNFDQLALACHEKPAEAIELARKGFLEKFLGNLGRADLAMAVREAARFPDWERGLDQFLAKLPTNVIHEAQLVMSPTEINLGQLQVGENRSLDLRLSNRGMRLVHGTIGCENCVWLAVGDAPGASQKIFQFSRDLTIPVHVRGKYLQANRKPLEGRLIIDSNAGAATVSVRAEVPVKPFPDGILSGARSPRQMAELAKQHPKQAVPFFENGAVAEWYHQNGWAYPVPMPPASGLGGIQQFFETLGLTPPPKVAISVPAVALQGEIGDRVDYALEIKTDERRPVYAYGRSDQPWLEVGRARLSGRTATLPLIVPVIPDQHGETLVAKVTVVANGNQKFVVPVTLEVGGGFQFNQPALEPGGEDLVFAPASSERPSPRAKQKAARQWLHGLPAALLGLALLLVVFWDYLSPPEKLAVSPTAAMPASGNPDLVVQFFPENRRFGIQVVQEQGANSPEEPKRLTYDKQGQTNNTCLKVGEPVYLFGQSPGTWIRPPRKDKKWQSVMKFPDEIQVTQTVEIVPNQQNFRYDTCLIHYLIENRSKAPQPAGIRVMLNTAIGSNDGVPFAIPGRSGLLETQGDYKNDEVPDYIDALERPSLADPGTIAQLGLKLPGFKLNDDDPDLDPISRLVICRCPDRWARWDWDFRPINEDPEKKNSCVVMYWAEQEIQPGSKRAVACTYGLGLITNPGSEGLELSVNRSSIRPNQEFAVTAQVKNPEPGQKVKINLPKTGEVSLVPGQDEEQAAEPGTGLNTWTVEARRTGTYRLEVTSGLSRNHIDIEVRNASAFR
jgi:hypothetical protein